MRDYLKVRPYKINYHNQLTIRMMKSTHLEAFET